MNRAARLETAAVFVVSAVACLAIAARLDPVLVHPGLDDIWFESDMARNFQTLTDRQFDNVWPAKHPVFALMVWPFVALFRLAGVEPLRAVQFVLSLNAGLFAAILMHLLRADGARLAERLAVLAVLLAAGAFWLWFAVPDTFAFGATSLLLGLTALAHDQRGAPAQWWRWILASVAALAITVTNFAAAGVALAVRMLLVAPGRDVFGGPLVIRLRAAGVILISAVVLIMIGSFIQNRVFPGTGYAFSPRALAQEQRFVARYGSSPPAVRLQTLIIASVVVGLPEQRGLTVRDRDGQLLSTLFVDGRWPGTLAGRLATVLWAGLFIVGTVATLRRGTLSPLAVAALILLVLQVVLHLFYGEMAFLYVAHLLPCALIVAARARVIIGRYAFVAACVGLAATAVGGSLAALEASSSIGGRMAYELLAQ